MYTYLCVQFVRQTDVLPLMAHLSQNLPCLAVDTAGQWPPQWPYTRSLKQGDSFWFITGWPSFTQVETREHLSFVSGSTHELSSADTLVFSPFFDNGDTCLKQSCFIERKKDSVLWPFKVCVGYSQIKINDPSVNV